MVEQQVRTWDVLDPKVLDVIEHTPRDHFVPQRYRNLAFADLQIPIGHGEVMMPPALEGRLLQALDLQIGDRVLEVGTGSGFVTACLARMANHVTSVDIYSDFTASAAAKLDGLGVANVSVETGDAVDGWGEPDQFDAIAVTGSVPRYREGFQRRLAIGGRLFVIVGMEPVMEALLVTRVGERDWIREGLFETVVPPLVNAAPPAEFEF
jgi:protein-L-isoaspartate(D-aspartate) O-methyltransferase